MSAAATSWISGIASICGKISEAPTPMPTMPILSFLPADVEGSSAIEDSFPVWPNPYQTSCIPCQGAITDGCSSLRKNFSAPTASDIAPLLHPPPRDAGEEQRCGSEIFVLKSAVPLGLIWLRL